MTTTTEFDTIDRQIDALQDRLDTYRQAMVLSRVAVFGSAAILLLVLTFATSFRTPTIVFSAVAAMIGGTVWLGASRSSLQDAQDELSALDAVKERMIDKVAVENGWRDLTPTVQ